MKQAIPIILVWFERYDFVLSNSVSIIGNDAFNTKLPSIRIDGQYINSDSNILIQIDGTARLIAPIDMILAWFERYDNHLSKSVLIIAIDAFKAKLY